MRRDGSCARPRGFAADIEYVRAIAFEFQRAGDRRFRIRICTAIGETGDTRQNDTPAFNARAKDTILLGLGSFT